MGVFNKRPPQSRYTFVSDIEVVLGFIKDSCLKSENFNFVDLTHKLTTLVASTSASIIHLNAKFRVKESNKVTVHINKLHKDLKKVPPSICYYYFRGESKLCF